MGMSAAKKAAQGAAPAREAIGGGEEDPEDEDRKMQEAFPAVQSYKQKKKLKDEDYECVESGLQALGREFDAFGVFDGHGGPDAAQLASRKFCRILVETLQRANREDADADEGRGWEQRVLPQALIDTFEALDASCNEEFKSSGTTATVMIIMRVPRIQSEGWALATVANVGDSHAHAEINGALVQLSADHRLDNNEEERARVESEGGEVARCSGVTDDAKADDPLRLWPGGLMMSRTIGDPDAKQSLAVPEITNMLVRLTDADEETPVSVRILLASDGLWDAVTPKQAFSVARNRIPQAASQTLMQTAVRNAGKDRDDITLVLVDLAADEAHFVNGARRRLSSVASSASHSPPVAAALPGTAAANLRLYHCWNPLSAESPRDEIAAAEAALVAEREAREEALREARKERARVDAALRASMEDDDAVAAQKAAEQAAAEEAEFEGDWEPVKRNSRRSNRGNAEAAAAAAAAAEEAAREEEAESAAEGAEGASEKEVSTDAAAADIEAAKGKGKNKTKKKGKKDASAADGGKDAKDSSERGVCFSFKKLGTCARGDKCRFSHAMPASVQNGADAGTAETPVSARDKAAEVCRAFQRPSGCPRGSRCKYLHVRKEIAEPTVKVEDEFLAPVKLAETAADPPDGGAAGASSTNSSSNNKENSAIASQAEVVGDWADAVESPMIGEALKGFNMVASAPAPSDADAAAPGQKTSKPPRNKKASKKPKGKKMASDTAKVCYTFQRDGACRFGDECKFSHAAPGPSSDPKEPKTTRRAKSNKAAKPSQGASASGKKKCFAFHEKGSCKFGDTCRYSHAS